MITSHRFYIYLALTLGVCLQTPARAATYNTRTAVQLLRTVAPHETLARFKKHLPRQTRYSWQGSTSTRDWTWNVLSFRGVRGGHELSGVVVFATDRARYAIPPPDTDPAIRNRKLRDVTAWRVADRVHSVHMFLGPERKVLSADAIDRDTKRQVDTITRLLGKPRNKDHERYGSGPEDAGWSATWRLSRGRSIRFAETLALLDSEVRPSLELTFSYSHRYRS